jgi:hypothetical protein
VLEDYYHAFLLVVDEKILIYARPNKQSAETLRGAGGESRPIKRRVVGILPGYGRKRGLLHRDDDLAGEFRGPAWLLLYALFKEDGRCPPFPRRQAVDFEAFMYMLANGAGGKNRLLFLL